MRRFYWVRVDEEEGTGRFLALVSERRAGRPDEAEDTVFEHRFTLPAEYATEADAYAAAMERLKEWTGSEDFVASRKPKLI